MNLCVLLKKILINALTDKKEKKLFKDFLIALQKIGDKEIHRKISFHSL